MSHQQRKDDHVAHAHALYRERRINDFDHLDFVHHSFPELDCVAISLATRTRAFAWPFPFYINGMTGGSAKTLEINRQLGEVAQATGLAIASGSQSAALKDPNVRASFSVLRERHPNGFVLGNVGAGVSPTQAEQAVEMLHADALQVHINAPQELVMPEGDREFGAWLDNIEAIRARVGVPVVVKEVGFGMSEETAFRLRERGVELVDVSGRGGTNFIAIENLRRSAQEYDYLEGWGQSAVVSLLEVSPHMGALDVLASGGVRHPLDVLKALALGARAVGVSGRVLHILLSEGPEVLIETLEAWKAQLRTLMAMVGATTVEELRHTDLLIRGPVREHCELRGIDPMTYARRARSARHGG
ncbi:type 2 isopentenyl-diphosphate Delta-isomerase [Halotalea alkalilenta]|uniref:Isopentenyl-diphosphate delta-isomerase n=1 Tax=Halotalea alkalilenta TaxID=376489 RepID=A0A172YHX3_9GAMM|nr:type 2 isopentenyl-diphosphate Delta-isomerase [Halotalea alkalilenta]ANF58841.1 type 2 isopentenyl-diphosphate Delta-isomerase [Halotalea alkalilenta]